VEQNNIEKKTVFSIYLALKGRKERCNMTWLDDYRMRLLLIVLVAAIVLGGSGRANADFAFGEPVRFSSTMLQATDDIDCFSSDGLEMYIDRGFGGGNGDLWVLKRASVDDDWGPPVNLGPAVNSSQEDVLASISADGLTLYFQSNRPGGYGDTDIYMTTRATQNDPWGTALNMGTTINSSATEADVWISTNGLELYFLSYRSGGYGFGDIWVARRATESDPWGVPVNLGPPVNSGYREHLPSLSPDGLLLLFSDPSDTTSPRPGGYGGADMWMTRRASLSDPWQTPANLGPKVNGPDIECLPRISPDGLTLYFCGTRSGAWDVWQVPIIPIVDFNGDEKVDTQDLLRLIESWGKDDPSVDIGPMSWGDGKVDENDLEVLMSYWQKEILSPDLVAYWKLDETEGDIAYDTVSDNDAKLQGDPSWQSTAGKVNGALQFDGIDDYITTEFVLNPADGSFSVFAWIKGGAPGQVILSQEGGANWLCIDSTKGNLMTELKHSQRREDLISQTMITDGEWHRIGFVWDSLRRALYVNGVVVAEDAQDVLEGSMNGLYIGIGKNMESSTFFAGLIDDVRIYNMALSAEKIAALAQ